MIKVIKNSEYKIKKLKKIEGLIFFVSLIFGYLVLARYAELYVIPFMSLVVLILVILEFLISKLKVKENKKRNIILLCLSIVSFIVLVWSIIILFV